MFSCQCGSTIFSHYKRVYTENITSFSHLYFDIQQEFHLNGEKKRIFQKLRNHLTSIAETRTIVDRLNFSMNVSIAFMLIIQNRKLCGNLPTKVFGEVYRKKKSPRRNSYLLPSLRSDIKFLCCCNFLAKNFSYLRIEYGLFLNLNNYSSSYNRTEFR